MKNVNKWLLVFRGFVVGNLLTSICFYSAFDQWKPMVWSAGINACLFIVITLINAMDES